MFLRSRAFHGFVALLKVVLFFLMLGFPQVILDFS